MALWPPGGEFQMPRYPELFLTYLSTYLPSLVLLSQMGTILWLSRPTTSQNLEILSHNKTEDTVVFPYLEAGIQLIVGPLTTAGAVVHTNK